MAEQIASGLGALVGSVGMAGPDWALEGVFMIPHSSHFLNAAGPRGKRSLAMCLFLDQRSNKPSLPGFKKSIGEST